MPAPSMFTNKARINILSLAKSANFYSFIISLYFKPFAFYLVPPQLSFPTKKLT